MLKKNNLAHLIYCQKQNQFCICSNLLSYVSEQQGSHECHNLLLSCFNKLTWESWTQADYSTEHRARLSACTLHNKPLLRAAPGFTGKGIFSCKEEKKMLFMPFSIVYHSPLIKKDKTVHSTIISYSTQY